MTQRRALTAGEYGRHPPPFVAQVAVANGVNTAMNAVEAAGAHAV
jgi:hypothetical protein